MAIHNDLIQAYQGYYEDDWMDEFSRSKDGAGNFAITYKEWLAKRTDEWIRRDSPRDRLRIYCEWNGILGYDNRIWEIAQGSFED